MLRAGIFLGDRYEIIEKIGAGGMAEVFKGRDHKLNRDVAIKVLRQEFSEDTNFVSKFRVEAQSAAGLTDKNIISIYDVGEENGLYYIVMELVEGMTLKRFIEGKGRLEIKQVISIAMQISMGLETAHKNLLYIVILSRRMYCFQEKEKLKLRILVLQRQQHQTQFHQM